MLETIEEVEESIDLALLRATLERVLSELPEREADVLCYRLGFDGEERTLREVGEILGVTTSRISQIEARALRLLRHPKYAKRLRPFVPLSGKWKPPKGKVVPPKWCRVYVWATKHSDDTLIISTSDGVCMLYKGGRLSEL